jgi:16S rRNA (cytidine1402-2'-O)-methyltransferase
MPGTLYVVATPIGNLEDITRRAARVLGEVGLVAAEDTRQTRKLLTHLGARPRLVSYNEHNAAQRTPRILRALLKEDVALVSDAGVPVVSDPGMGLVRAAAEQGTPVVPLPGPSAVTAALAVAGMSGDAFRFLGFPPRARKARRALFASVDSERSTLVLFEAPHRVRATLEDLQATLGDRRQSQRRHPPRRRRSSHRRLRPLPPRSLPPLARHLIGPPVEQSACWGEPLCMHTRQRRAKLVASEHQLPRRTKGRRG